MKKQGEQWDIRPVFTYYGVEAPQRANWSNVKCPFHEDRHASGRSTYDDGGAFFCNACDAGGNAITLIMQREGLDRVGAIRFYEESLGGSVSDVQRSAPRERRRALSDGARDYERGTELVPPGGRSRPNAGR